jgi:hypothetical protein
METIADYKARILSYIEGKDPIEVQRKTPELLADLVVSVPEKKLRERPSPDKWSVAAGRFADAEIVNTWRYRQMIEHDGFAQLTPEEWQRNGIHAERGPMTVRDLAVQIAGHDLNHLEQVRKILGE